MFVAGAVCPHPPLLVPEIAAGAAAELDALRAACLGAVEHLLHAGPTRVLLVGDGPEHATYGAGAVADFAPYGVDVQRSLGPGDPAGRLPLSLSIGAWLLAQAGCAVDVTAVAVPSGCPTAEAAMLARAVMGDDERVSILAMGDGSARRTPSAPGYVDARAVGFDQGIAAALATADTDAVLAIDPALAVELLCAGRASWQVLAGAAAGHTRSAQLLYDAAPYGVGYFVATWSP